MRPLVRRRRRRSRTGNECSVVCQEQGKAVRRARCGGDGKREKVIWSVYVEMY